MASPKSQISAGLQISRNKQRPEFEAETRIYNNNCANIHWILIHNSTRDFWSFGSTFDRICIDNGRMRQI
jgi:hypothetical protein